MPIAKITKLKSFLVRFFFGFSSFYVIFFLFAFFIDKKCSNLYGSFLFLFCFFLFVFCSICIHTCIIIIHLMLYKYSRFVYIISIISFVSIFIQFLI